MDGFIACFDGLEDPRTGNAGRHDLLEILMIALCTVLCGGQSAVDMAEFAEDKEAFLRSSACCTAEEEAKDPPFPTVDQATRTEFGHPRSSIRLRT